MKWMRYMMMSAFMAWGATAVAMDNITFEQAKSQALAETNANNRHDFIITKHETKPYGWIFYYAPRRFVETKNTDFLVPGTGPVVVTHEGIITQLGSARPAKQLIQQFEANRGDIAR